MIVVFNGGFGVGNSDVPQEVSGFMSCKFHDFKDWNTGQVGVGGEGSAGGMTG